MLKLSDSINATRSSLGVEETKRIISAMQDERDRRVQEALKKIIIINPRIKCHSAAGLARLFRAGYIGCTRSPRADSMACSFRICDFRARPRDLLSIRK